MCAKIPLVDLAKPPLLSAESEIIRANAISHLLYSK